MIQRLALLAVVLLCGCSLYWGGGGSDDVCNPVGVGFVPARELRNPLTGSCEAIGGGGGCNNTCGPCGYGGSGSDAAEPDWGSCFGSCAALDEHSCLAAANCHAAYLESGAGSNAQQFWACWELPPSGAIHTGSCAQLDAQTCSEHTDCVSNFAYAKTVTASQRFASCAPEKTTTNVCDLVDACTPGTHCEQQCTPCDLPAPNGCMGQCKPICVADTTCANVDCGAGHTCVETCAVGTNGQPGQCYPQCVPVTTDPGSCSGTVTCGNTHPACPVNTTAGIANGCYTGYCIPNAECGPHDPGTCTGAVTCLTGEPVCPAGTVAGIRNGCWSGYCIPQNACPVPACSTLTTEASCHARGDCIPVYAGMNCTCYPDHCVCQSQTYARCESTAMPL